MTLALLALLLGSGGGDGAYRVVPVPAPEGAVLEVGGLAVEPSGRAWVSTRRGELWVVDGAFDEPPAPRFTRAAEGLQEPLGVLLHEGSVLCVQRGELSRLRDLDGDDRIDVVETVSDAWQLSGNYHEYNFGPVVDAEGNLWITTNKPFGAEPFGRVDWRGFALRVAPDGTTTPMCSGLRSPAGIAASPMGPLFYTDNQGEWCGASKLSRLRPGSYHGHPWGAFSCEREEWTFPVPPAIEGGRTYPAVAAEHEQLELPAVWFPYDKTGRSPCGLVWDETGGAFGPFAGQVFVGDQYAASILRVDLEEVDGHWQGAVFPFLDGLASGVTRLAFGPDGSLLVGSTDRGWAALGTATFGLERVVWSGEVPFEVLRVRARPGGFRVELTHPADPATADDPASYRASSYTYLLHETYGSDEVDPRELEVRGVRVAEDGRSLELDLDGLRPGYVHELHFDGLRDEEGAPLVHPDAYYTLIRLP